MFEDVILIRCCIQGTRELHEIATRTAQLEATNAQVERKVVERTAKLQGQRKGTQARQGCRRGRQPGQERIPGKHESRNTHSHERHHRHDGIGARHDPHPQSARTVGNSPLVRRFAAGTDERPLGFFQDRGRQAQTGQYSLQRPRRFGRRGQGTRDLRHTKRIWNSPAMSTARPRWNSSAIRGGCDRS